MGTATFLSRIAGWELGEAWANVRVEDRRIRAGEQRFIGRESNRAAEVAATRMRRGPVWGRVHAVLEELLTAECRENGPSLLRETRKAGPAT